MSNVYRVIIVSLSAILGLGCGGGSGGSGAGNGTDLEDGVDTTSTLKIEFTGSPLEPNTANIRSGVPEHEFDVGHTLSIFWQAYVYQSDGSPAQGTYVYKSEVYLSDDTSIDANDVLLFSVDCSLPNAASGEYACSQYASFQCAYQNDNSLSCLSIPPDNPSAFKDLVVDISEVLDTIPKVANIIYKVCLQGRDSCDLATTGIVLN